MKASIYFNYTSRSLVRGGQRTVLAIFCVAVGVMAIVSLQLVGLMINNAFNSNVRDANGGDIAVTSQNQPFTQSDLAYFDQLKKDGSINNYTALITTQASTGAQLSLRASFSVRVVDPQNYPVVNQPSFTSPANGNVADLLKDKHIIVTQPFIDQYKKKIGDTVEIHMGGRTGDRRVIKAQIAGIVTASGVFAQSGSAMLLSINDYKNAAVQPVAPSSSPTPGAQPAGATQGGAPSAQGTQGTAPSDATPSSPQTGTGARSELVYDTIDIVAPAAQIDGAAKKIQNQFPIANTQTANDALKQQQDTIDNIRKFLEIAGLLALLIGGVGIVNTMQVLLSRRKTEIAMLKTTGYRRFDLYLLFGLEAGMLGLIGGIIGAGAATLVSYLVRNLVQQTFQLTIPFLLDGVTIGGGVVIGLVTALIFGLLPIVQAANIRPLNVIREMPEGRGASSFVLTGVLLLVLSILFCGLAIVILNNDIVLGLVSVYGTFLFLALLSIFFGLIILLISKLPVPENLNAGYLGLILGALVISGVIYWLLPSFGVLFLAVSLLGLVVVFLPRTWKATIKMAFRNLGRQRARTTTTMLALFVGIFTIGLILVLGQNLRDQVNKLLTNSLNYNVFAITSNADTTKLQNKLPGLPGLSTYQQHSLVSSSPISVNGRPIKDVLPKKTGGDNSSSSVQRMAALYFLSGIEGYDVGNNQIPNKSTVKIVQGRNLALADAGTSNVLISAELAKSDSLHLKVGDKITLASVDRVTTDTVTVVGIYKNVTTFGGGLYPVLGTTDSVNKLLPAGFSQSIFYLKVNPDKLNSATDIIGNTVPNAFVLNLASISDFIDQLLNDILLTLTTIASLSLIAGIIIIANAVALAMLERRRELGILKSVGYTSRTILSEVLLENGLVGGVGALLAMLIVAIVTWLLSVYVFKSTFTVSSLVSLGLILGSAALAMLTAALVAWGAVRVRPLEVLRYE
ncbi:ABC transporter permease [Tengunoibacter tsumagoiensis]|uniref:Glycosyl transferase family 1 n=1 Tax=Tengunoibacter tsumagoiensis TaxID=2014871 RepID=A0A401ZXJ2_9CHLR|nr:FtsX-like permease family protein [Tengunoibacter tsumagoiensis]GCE11555.1 hypothetical protein KTT_14140 [Tengunoibacter tsumagoiensis]